MQNFNPLNNALNRNRVPASMATELFVRNQNPGLSAQQQQQVSEDIGRRMDTALQAEAQEATTELAAATRRVNGLIEEARLQTCTFCFGWGHGAKVCASKKKIDVAVRGFPTMKMAWGKMKAASIKESVGAGMTLNVVQRKRDQKAAERYSTQSKVQHQDQVW